MIPYHIWLNLIGAMEHSRCSECVKALKERDFMELDHVFDYLGHKADTIVVEVEREADL